MLISSSSPSAASLLRTCCGSSSAVRRLSSFGFVGWTLGSHPPLMASGRTTTPFASVTRLSKRSMFTTATTTIASTLASTTTKPTTTTATLGTLLQLRRRVSLSSNRAFSAAAAPSTQPIIEFVEEESPFITTPKGEQFSKDIDLKAVVDKTYIADIALLSSSFAFISSFLFWGALAFFFSMIGMALDALGLTEEVKYTSTIEEIKEEKDESGETKPQEEEAAEAVKEEKPTATATATTSNTITYPPVTETTGLEALAWVLLPLGIVAASIGRVSLWHLSRNNLPHLREMIFGGKTDMFVWAQRVAYASAPVYVTGGTVLLMCYPSKAVKEVQSDGTVSWKWVRTFETDEILPSIFLGLFVSFFGCFIMAPGITMGGYLGSSLIQRRMLINARKLQQQMNSYLSQKKVKVFQ